MNAEPLFAEPSPSPPPRVCAWCGGSPTQDFQLEPDRYGIERVTRARVLKKRAIVAQACAGCAARMAPTADAPVVA